MLRLRWSVGLLVACSASRVAAGAKDFDVQFGQCAEFVGIGYVPAAQARARVPAHYTLAGDGTNAFLVVRVVKCAAVSVDGKPAKAAQTAQIGVMLQGPDTSADINNYLLWFVTDLAALNGKFQASGVDCNNDQQMSSVFDQAASTLTIDVSAPAAAAYQVDGDAEASSAAATTFIASWWYDGQQGSVRMRSEFPQIRFGEAAMTLTTAANSQLATLIGGTSMQFAILDSYNDFNTALLQARLQ